MNMLSAEEVQTFKNNLCIPDLIAKANRMEHFCYFSKYQSLPFFMENYESVLMFLSKTLLPLYYLKAKLKVYLIIDDNQLAIVKNKRLLIINHREREIKRNILVTEKRCGIYYIASISGSKLALGTNYPNGLCFIVDITHNLVQELEMGELINGLSYSGNSNILLVLTRNKYIIYYLEDDKRIYSNLYSTQRHIMRYGENQWIAANTLGFLCIHVFNYQEQEPHLVTTRIINRKKRERDTISCMTLIDENLLAIGTAKGFIQIWNLSTKTGKSIRNLRLAENYRVDSIHIFCSGIISVMIRNSSQMKIILFMEKETKVALPRNYGPLIRLYN